MQSVWSQASIRKTFYKRWTQITITTYGMMWQWLTQPDGYGRSKVLWENFAFVLDELAGTPGGEEGDTRIDPQFLKLHGSSPRRFG